MSGLTETPNLDAEKPTGMCGEPKVCEGCPSHFLCSSKARAELNAIRSREAK